ncbi:hypothetical protein C7M84_006013 [Penaeus vannamei]|uniref:Uncharacterized protein n=1 Tax=Penaeus vannamei TaxID=6689 RepID=A0A3R7MG37_PENVA|nr:hypothetical protein C7M84_006013 [Penaeus vannamei]
MNHITPETKPHLKPPCLPPQPLLIYLDSVDQVTGATDANRMSWIPTRLPPNVKIVVSCVSEDNDPELSKDYTLLRRMIDNVDNFLEVRALGEDLAMDIIKKWMCTAKRDLNNYQWRVVSNAISRCSLPIFVKLVFRRNLPLEKATASRKTRSWTTCVPIPHAARASHPAPRTRIRNDCPNYLSDCEADGVSVLNWYHSSSKRPPSRDISPTRTWHNISTP